MEQNKRKENCIDCYSVNEGIKCDVKNCYYHAGECNCTADKISVGPSFAATSNDTVCSTFKEKKD